MRCARSVPSKRQLLERLVLGSLVGSLSGAIALPAQAQNIPNNLQPQRPLPELPSPETPKPDPALENQLPPADATPAGESIPPDAKICLLGFDVQGSTVFSSRDLEQVALQAVQAHAAASDESCAGYSLSFAEILTARAAIAQHYLDHHYLGTTAFVPAEQTLQLSEDRLVIQVVEGQVEAIRVTGTKRLAPGYVRDRIAVFAATPLNQQDLLSGLRLLQFNPLIERVDAELSEGSQPGRAILEVRVQENVKFARAIPRLDNHRAPSVGSFRRSLELELTSLTGFGDTLTAAIRNTDGSTEGEFGYTIPFNPHDGTLSLRYQLGTGRVIEPPFDKIDLESDYRSYEVSLRQPVLRRASETAIEELALGLRFSRQESETSILGVPFPLSAGGDDQGRTRISAVRFFQEWQQFSARSAWFARSEFSLGVDWFGATVNGPDPFSGEPVPDSNFFAWRGQVQWLQVLNSDTTLRVRTDVQFADRVLVPFERFGLGGATTVRGYRQDARLTDNGLLASVELQWSFYRFPDGSGQLALIPFVDAGAGWNSSGFDSVTPNALASGGIGLLLQYGNFSARLDWGIPLVEIDSRNRTWQENGFYFLMQYKLE